MSKLLHKCRFRQNYWNRLCVTSGDDGGWRKLFKTCCKLINTHYSVLSCHSIHNEDRETKSVAFNNKVMDAWNWHSHQGVLPKYDVDNRVQCGRSMIEMLGVLAIIGVLSVGGIAGYSKAMEQFKVNKLLKEYTELISGLIEYSDNIKKLPTTYETRITNYAINLGLVPNTWQRIDHDYIADSEGNFIGIKHRVSDTALQGIVVDFLLGGLSQDENNEFTLSSSFQPKLCVDLFNKLVKPLHDVVTIGYVHRENQNVEFYYGDKYCKNNYKCLKDMTFSDAERMCSKCDKKRRCSVVIAF